MSNQSQHRIPQVYLRKFGYTDNNGKKWVSVWEQGSEYTDNKSIKSFTAETNIFDLPFIDLKERRRLEELNGDIETNYPKIINELEAKQELTEKNRTNLITLIVNLLYRSNPFRKQIDYLLRSNKRNYFLSEITYYHEDKGNQLVKSLQKIKVDYQLNIVLFSVLFYFTKKLTSSNFDYVIIRDFSNRGWATSDNPVVIINNVNEETILSKETEIYFPITPEYMFYLDHMDYGRSYSLRGTENKEVVQSTEELHQKISEIVWTNADQYVIFPVELEKTKISNK